MNNDSIVKEGLSLVAKGGADGDSVGDGVGDFPTKLDKSGDAIVRTGFFLIAKGGG